MAVLQAAGIAVVVHCEGDRHIDAHHTAEDVAITLGQGFHEALGEKKGLARMGCAEGAQGEARVRAARWRPVRRRRPRNEAALGGRSGARGRGRVAEGSSGALASTCGPGGYLRRTATAIHPVSAMRFGCSCILS